MRQRNEISRETVLSRSILFRVGVVFCTVFLSCTPPGRAIAAGEILTAASGTSPHGGLTPIGAVAPATTNIIYANQYLSGSSTGGVAEANAQCSANGCEIILPCGDLTITKPIPLRNNVIYEGCGAGSAGAKTGGTRIFSSTSDLFVPAVSGQTEILTGVTISDFYAEANDNGGHIFNLSGVDRAENLNFYNLALQSNHLKSILSYNGGYFSKNTFRNISVWYAANNAMPAFDITANYIYSNQFNGIITNSGSGNIAAGDWVFSLNAYPYSNNSGNNSFLNIILEEAGGGGFQLVGLQSTTMDNVEGADMTATPLNPFIYLNGWGLTIMNSGAFGQCFGETQSVPDLYIHGSSPISIINSSLCWVTATSETPVTLIGNSTIINRKNLNAVAVLGGTAGIEFLPDTTDNSDSTFTIWKGNRGWYDGALHIDVNSVTKFTLDGAGNLYLGGILTSANTKIGNNGEINAVSMDLSNRGGVLKIDDQGACTEAYGGCEAQALGHSYSTPPLCFCALQSGKISSTCSCTTTTTTATPRTSGSDTATLNWFVLGN